ncbi:MAG: DUF58 domain-containing protein [Thermodesulfovibrionales bacterium]|jgi:uncharacterized protein (DUF58 family)
MRSTGEGKRFFLAAFMIALAAFNTGNNLIYLILSMMLAIFFLSIIVLKINMRKLMLNVYQDNPVYADTPASIAMTMANKKRIASRSVKVMSSGMATEGIYFPLIPARSEVTGSFPVIFRKRGIYRYGDFLIESGYPFIFFTKRVFTSVKGEIIVYPEIKDIDSLSLPFPGEGHEQSPSRIGEGEEFTMFREFRYGDDSRRIHWKASAKTNKLLLMEYSSDEFKKMTIILDNLMFRDENSFEKAVSFAASLTDRFLKDGYFVRLLTCSKVVPFGNSTEHLYKILDILAAIESRDSWECPLSVEPQGLTILILSSEQSLLKRFISLSDMVIYAHLL